MKTIFFLLFLSIFASSNFTCINKLAYSDLRIPPVSQTQKSNFSQQIIKLKTFEFEIIELGFKGQIQKKYKGSNLYFAEDLGEETTLDMVTIPEGTFVMGATELDLQMDYEDVLKKGSFSIIDAKNYSTELPQRKFNVQSFFIGKFEITQAQWKAVALLPVVKRKLKPFPARFKDSNLPVGNISWEDCQEFCARLSHKTGKHYRLPSETEWEYAARAGTTTLFHFGDVITTDSANYDGAIRLSSFTPKGIYRNRTTPVGSFGFANAFGLYDMHGNVQEWCQDPSMRYDRPHFEPNSRREMRGGSFASSVRNCRSAFRIGRPPSEKEEFYGFRVAVSLN